MRDCDGDDLIKVDHCNGKERKFWAVAVSYYNGTGSRGRMRQSVTM